MKYVFKEYDLEKVDLKVLLERYIKEITNKRQGSSNGQRNSI